MSGVRRFVLEVSHWTVLYGWVDQLKLTAVILRRSLRQYMLLSAEGYCHTQSIQINKVIGENKTCVLHFMEKTKWTF